MINILRARVCFLCNKNKKKREKKRKTWQMRGETKKKRKKKENVKGLNEANGQGNREVTRRWGGHDANARYTLEQFH